MHNNFSDENTSPKELFLMFNSGDVFVTETLEQIECLVDMLEIGNEESPSIKWRSITTSIIIMLFNLLEGYANFLIVLTINIDNGKLIAPTLYRHLSEVERLALTECTKILDTRTGKETLKEKAYMRTIDKLCLAPLILERLYNSDATMLEKGTLEFQQLIKLQELRDGFMHVKHDIDLLPQAPVLDFEYHVSNYANLTSYNIDGNSLFSALNSVAWYLHKQFVLLRKLFYADKLSLDIIETKIMTLQIKLNNILKIKSPEKYAAKIVAHRAACMQDFIVGAPDDDAGVEIRIDSE